LLESFGSSFRSNAGYPQVSQSNQEDDYEIGMNLEKARSDSQKAGGNMKMQRGKMQPRSRGDFIENPLVEAQESSVSLVFYCWRGNVACALIYWFRVSKLLVMASVEQSNEV
jgi:hypothetical protein